MKIDDKLLPPEPPAIVRAVQDCDGAIWHRRPDGTGWSVDPHDSKGAPWEIVCTYAPLTVANVVESIVITRTMAAGGYRVYCEINTGNLVADFATAMKAALESAGVPCEIDLDAS